MKRKRSLWKFLREELESERGDLVFLLMLLIPVAVAIALVVYHYVLNHQIGDIVDYASSSISRTNESEEGKQGLDKKLRDLLNINDQRGEHVTKP